MSEKLARQFHEIYERLAPEFGYETRTETREFDPHTPNGRLMIAVCSEIDSTYHTRLAEAERLLREAHDYPHKLDSAHSTLRGRIYAFLRPADTAQAASLRTPDDTLSPHYDPTYSAPCTCGAPSTKWVTHRTDGPCYVTDSASGEKA